MAKVRVTIGGLAILVGSKEEGSGEIALVNPDPAHLLPSDLVDFARHPPILVARSETVRVDGRPHEVAIGNDNLRSQWLDAAEGFEGFQAWSLQGAEISLRNARPVTPTPDVEFVHEGFALTAEGCNDEPESFRSLEWVANVNEIYSNLRLAPEWRQSPHVGARLVLGGGTLSATVLVPNTGFQRVDFGGGERVFTDAFEYEVELDEPILVVKTRSGVWSLRLDADGQNPIRLWLLSLDEQVNNDVGFAEHVVLYSYLPWRFRNPEVKGACTGAVHTDGGCIPLRFNFHWPWH